jgi:hypothetical protein
MPKLRVTVPWRAGVALLCTTALVSGCSAIQSLCRVEAPPLPPWSESAAPPIATPLHALGNYTDSPCALLSPDEVVSLGTAQGGTQQRTSTGNACVWPAVLENETAVWVSLLNLKSGWQDVHDDRASWAVFEPVGPVNGYPAVHVADSREDVARGICATLVGATPDLLFQVVVFTASGSGTYTDPCSVSDRAASLVIDTVRADR